MDMNYPLSGTHFALMYTCQAAVKHQGDQLAESILEQTTPLDREMAAQMGLVKLVTIVNQVLLEKKSLWDDEYWYSTNCLFCPAYILQRLVGELEQRNVERWVSNSLSNSALRVLARSLREAASKITFEGELPEVSTLQAWNKEAERLLDYAFEGVIHQGFLSNVK